MADEDRPVEDRPRSRSGTSNERVEQRYEPYWCCDCDTTYPERGAFNEHLAAQHPGRATFGHLCRHCGVEYRELAGLREHTKECHRGGDQLHRCDLCHCTFVDRQALAYHWQRHQDFRTRRTCRVCCRLFASQQELREHVVAGHLPWSQNYECQLCTRKFTRTYAQFRRSQGKTRYWKDGKTRKWVPMCDRCCSLFSRVMPVGQNQNCDDVSAGDGRQPLRGDQRGDGSGGKGEQKNNEEGQVQRKMESELKPKKIGENKQVQYRCGICKKKSNNPKTMLKHLEIHKSADGRSYVCEKCGKTYKIMEELIGHRRICVEPTARPYHAPH